MEAGVPRPIPGRADVPERGRRVHGYFQLPEPGFDPSGRVAGDPETELPGDPSDHRDAGTESGISEGHPVTLASLARRHDRERVHARVARECAADGRNGLLDAHHNSDAAGQGRYESVGTGAVDASL